MALKREPDKLFEEVRAARDFRKKHLCKWQEMIDSYASYAYRSDVSSSFQENHYYEFVRLTTASVVYDNPRVRVKTRRSGSQGQVATAMQGGLNRWCVDYDVRKMLKQAYVQSCFAWTPILTTIEQRPWFDPRAESIPMWPACYRLQPDRFFFDPVADSFDVARYAGHTYVRDLSDIEAEPGWNMDVLRTAKRSSDSQIDGDMKRSGEKYIPDRDEVVLHEMWIPEWDIGDPKDGFHGALVTIVEGNGSEWVRAPRPYYGPRWGPYTLFGAYDVPNDSFPLSPFAATFEQVKWLNKVVSASNKSMESYKRLVLCPADNPDLLNKIKGSKHDLVIPVVGLTKDVVVPIEIGGLTPQHLQQIEMMLARVDRNTGIGEVQRGNVDADATATAVSVADSAADASLAYLKQEFGVGVVKVLKTVGWYLYHDDQIEFPIGADPSVVDPMTGMPMMEPWFVGGSFDVNSGATFDDLELEIEPYSMERTNDALERAQAMQKVEAAIEVIQFASQNPAADGKAMLRSIGTAFNDKDIEEWYNADVAGMMIGAPGLQSSVYPPAQNPGLSKAGDKPKNADLGAMNGAVQRKATAGVPMGMGR